MDEFVGVRPFFCRRRRAKPTTGCASSPWNASCRSRGIRRLAHVTPGSSGAATATRIAWFRSAARGSFRSSDTMESGRLARRRSIRSGSVDEEKLDEIARFLQIDRSRIVEAEWCDNGPGWIGHSSWFGRRGARARTCAAIPKAHGCGRDRHLSGRTRSWFELRTFFSNHRLRHRRDPVTGSFNASAAQWMIRSGRANTPYTRRARNEARPPRSHFDQSTRRRSLDRRKDSHDRGRHGAYTLRAAAASASRFRLRASWARPFRYCGGQWTSR